MKFVTNIALTNSPITPSVLFPEPKTKGGHFIELSEGLHLPNLFFSRSFVVFRPLLQFSIQDVVINQDHCRCHNRPQKEKERRKSHIDKKATFSVSSMEDRQAGVSKQICKDFFCIRSAYTRCFQRPRQTTTVVCQIINNDHLL